ncbi:MAG: hypothetical protein MUF31_11770 [Akkermansiaceae bacterium]|jgi:hypothetical protein|nr:hypothetical protein [Akkermansiaceae bacterium]
MNLIRLLLLLSAIGAFGLVVAHGAALLMVHGVSIISYAWQNLVLAASGTLFSLAYVVLALVLFRVKWDTVILGDSKHQKRNPVDLDSSGEP